MRILMLSLDKSLLDNSGVGDTLQRFKYYSEYLERLDVLIPTTTMKNSKVRKINDILTIYPCYGRNRVFSLLKLYLTARKICKENSVDLIVTQDPLVGLIGLILKREFGCKLNVNVFGLEIFNELIERNYTDIIYRLITYYVLKNADVIRTDGTRDRKTLIRKLNLFPEEVYRIPVIPSPESILKFISSNGISIRNKLLENKYNNIILFVGMLIKIKNVPNLLHAAKIVLKKHPRTLFVIVGDGPEREYLQKLCVKLKIQKNVKFLGLIRYENIPEYFAACDIFVLPSWSEGFARVLMEAAYAKKPIVSTNVSGADDIIVCGKSGFIVDINDPEALAEKIIWLLENPKEIKKMGRIGFKHALKTLNFEKNVEKLIEMWGVKSCER